MIQFCSKSSFLTRPSTQRLFETDPAAHTARDLEVRVRQFETDTEAVACGIDDAVDQTHRGSSRGRTRKSRCDLGIHVDPDALKKVDLNDDLHIRGIEVCHLRQRTIGGGFAQGRHQLHHHPVDRAAHRPTVSFFCTSAVDPTTSASNMTVSFVSVVICPSERVLQVEALSKCSVKPTEFPNIRRGCSVLGAARNRSRGALTATASALTGGHFLRNAYTSGKQVEWLLLADHRRSHPAVSGFLGQASFAR
jgi:hypothetical protein